MKTKILYEDNEILVVGKPAGMPTQTANAIQTDVVSELKQYLSEKKPVKKDIKADIKSGNKRTANKKKINREPYLGVIHRLDQPVAGVLVFAKTPSAAAALTKQLTENKMQKEYLAAVYFPKPKFLSEFESQNYAGKFVNTEEAEKEKSNPDNKDKFVTLVDYLLKDGKTNTSSVVTKNTPNAKKAELTYEILKITQYEAASAALLKVILKTGRHHQIRVQLAHAGMPLLGDQKYGNETAQKLSAELSIKDVALCAKKLTFYHPVNGKPESFVYPDDTVEVHMLGVTIWNS